MIKKLLLRLQLHWYERNNVVKFEWWVGAYRQACTGGSRGRRVGPNLLPWKALISFYRSSETASMSPESFHLCRPFPTAVTTLGSLRFTCSVQVSFISLWCCLYIWPKERCVFFFLVQNGAFKAHTNSSDWAFGLVWASLNSTKTLADAIYTHPLYYTHPSPHFCYANRHKYPPLKNHPILICFISPLSQHRPKLP